MRPILIILMLPLLAMLAGCASDGDEASPAVTDPLVAMHHGALTKPLTASEAQLESSDEEPDGQPAENRQRASQAGPVESGHKEGSTEKVNDPNQAVPQPTKPTPGIAAEPRHQSLVYESAPLSGESKVNQTKRGDPLLGTYHRQLTAAPLSDDLALNPNDHAAAKRAGQEPAAGFKPEQSANPNKVPAPEADQPHLQASLYLRPQDKAPAAEIKPLEPAEDEPTLVNPPEQTPASQIWIEQVDLIEAKGQIIIGIQLSGKRSPNIYILNEYGDRPMLVLDFPGVTGLGFPQRIGVPPSIATAIRMANHPKKAQIVVDLIPHKNYEVQPAWIKGQHKLLVSINLILS